MIPTLKFWEGERVYRGKHGESGVVAVAVQGAACMLFVLLALLLQCSLC